MTEGQRLSSIATGTPSHSRLFDVEPHIGSNLTETERGKIALDILLFSGHDAQTTDYLQVLGHASYPLVDLVHPSYTPNCEWDLLKKHGEMVGFNLRYKGRKNRRYHMYGSREVVEERIAQVIDQAGAKNITNIPLVVNGSDFAADELPNLLGPEWKIRPDKDGAVYQLLTRTVVNKELYRPPNSNERPLPSNVNPTPRVLTPKHLPNIKNLLQYYKHNAFHEDTLQYGNHLGYFTREGHLIAMAGISAQIRLEGLSAISLQSDLVTHPEYAGSGLATRLRGETIKRLFIDVSENNEPYKDGILVADCNSLSVPIMQRLGYVAAGAKSSYYWVSYDRVQA